MTGVLICGAEVQGKGAMRIHAEAGLDVRPSHPKTWQ